MSLDKIKKQKIYTHTQLDPRDADRIQALMESAYSDLMEGYQGNRAHIGKERMRFAAEQFANRCRIAKTMGTVPLNEDANIFGKAFPTMKNLFESTSHPGNIVGMGNVTNPMEGNAVPGGMWNSNYRAGSGDIPTYAFGLQSQLAMHCIGFDLLPTISVDTPKVVVQFIDTVYGGGTFDDAENLPSFIEISCPLFIRKWIMDKKLKRSVSKLVIAAKTNEAIEVRFVMGSTIRAAVTVEVLSTGTLAGTAYTKNNNYSVKQVIDIINKAYEASSSDKGSVLVSVDGGTTYATAETVDGMFGIDYASATRTNIAEAASNDNSLGGMSRAQHAKGPKHKLNVKMLDKQLEMVGIEIEADTDNIQIKDMASAGINVIAYLYSGVQNQLVQTIDEVILNHLYALGVQHAVNAYESQGINYSLYIGNPANPTLAMSNVDVTFENMLGEDCRSRMGNLDNVLVSAAYENQLTHGQRLYSRLLVISEFISYDNRQGAADFVVVPGELCACLKKQSTFTTTPVANTLSQSPELHYSGTIYDTISVYKNPRIGFNDPRILFGRRGTEYDSGAKFLAYDLASSRQTIAEDTMSDKIRVWSRFAIADIGFYPELNYYTGVFVNDYKWT